MQDDKRAIQGEGALPGDADASRMLTARRMSSADLFAGAREIEIEHNGRQYRLRITQTGKLILTA
jgi:hemin uptake protein HemP